MRAMAALALLTCLALSAPAEAQQARARVRGEVAGLEMGLEGALSAPRGGTLRWLVTGYEVLGLSELRPAAGVEIHVATSLEQTEETVVTADALGHAAIAVAIPDDAPDSFRVVLRLVQGTTQRRFELSVSVVSAEAIEVHVDRAQLVPGGPVRAFGRASDRRSGAPRAGATVRLTLRDGENRPLATPVDVTTDAAGLFAHTFRLPAEVRGGVRVEARAGTDEHPVASAASAVVMEPVGAPVLVAVAPERSLLRPGERVAIDVAVRTGNGRPIEGAVVTLDGAAREDADRRALTDARGRARLAWTAPSFSSGLHDARVSVTASREGLGRASGSAAVRIAADEHAAALAIEGGALSPELGGRVWVRVVGADGLPASAGVPVRLEGPRFPSAGLSAATDADGIATFDLALGPATDATADRCGGQSATALTVRVGTTTLAPCLPLDPDAAARVRVARPLSLAGAPLEIAVDRVRAAARAPVELTVLTPGAVAVAAAILGPAESRASLPIPDDVSGLLIIRARPLIGARSELVRGGSAAVWVSPGAPLAVEASLSPEGQLGARFTGPADEGAHAYVVAAPIDLARALATSLRARTLGPFGELRRDPAAAGEPLLFAALAASTPPDVSAPAVLRERSVVPVPAPSEPTSVGLLRDPWRARARFVTGRLALIFHALEAYVADALPERIDDVAVRGPRGFELNGQILESGAASGSLGPSGATGLAGEPLTIEELRRFDPSLTYDNVARRITRERLFRLLLALRSFVQSQGFDLPWSRLGDPSSWLRHMAGQYVPAVGSIDRRALVDGWGRPFELVPARGGRSRFSFVDPLGAWELVSAGPDGRIGSGDDVWDPTARVLRSGTPYAEAVGEDVLVARLEGVELGRASLALLSGTDPQAGGVGGVPHQSDAPARRLAQELWSTLPAVFEPDPEPLALRRPAHPGTGAGGRIAVIPREGGATSITLDEEPRTWGAVVYAWTPRGWGSVGLATALAGAPIIVEGEVPSRLRTGEPVTLDLTLTNVADAASLRVEASGEGVEVTGPREVAIGSGEAAPIALRLLPSSAPGAGAVTLTLRDAEGAVRTVRWRTRRVTGLHPLRLRAAGLARGRDFVATLPVPADAERIAGRVVILAPSALAADPDLADLRRRDPALVAWSDALAGRRSDPALWARLLRAQSSDGTIAGDDPIVSSAAAMVALAGAGEHDREARAALERLRRAFAGMGELDGQGLAPEEVRSASAALAALAAGGVPELDVARRRADPVLRVAASARAALRHTLRNHPEEPSLLARAAAALLLADPADSYGLAMLERASAHLSEAPDGGALVLPSERMRDPLEALSATFALAIAAHQAEQPALAERLARGGLGREHVALRRGGEAALWLLAAGAYGVLGLDAERVTVVIDGAAREVALEGGRGVVALSPGGHEVRVIAGDASAFVRAELAMERPYVSREDGPLRLELRGDAGGASDVAALELSIRAEREVASPVIDLALPAGIDADEALLGALRRAGSVVHAEPREPGMVRVALAPMAAGTETILPLPLRWRVRGTLRGLAAVAYPAGDPGAMTVLPPRELTIDGR